MPLRIALASDHRGVELKAALRRQLEVQGFPVRDFGTDTRAPVDYPDFAISAARAISRGECQRGILICGSGVGVAIAANRFAGVRAAQVECAEIGELSRRHNDANVIALAADRLGAELAWELVERWLDVPFEGGRHSERVAKLDAAAAGGGALEASDPELARLLRAEAKRQALGLELIASENFVSEAVLEATASVLTNKYAEGYPGRRYYGGCEVVDEVERLAVARARALFGADHVNVQPHSGSQANEAVYRAVLDVGDTLLAMNLDHGGHLTHGSPVNFSGKLYRIVPYGVRRDTEEIDMDALRDLAREHRPKLIQCGTTAYSRRLDFSAFRKIADEVGAVLFADIAHIAGLVAAGVHPTPVGSAQIVATTTHKTLRGPRGGMILCDGAWQKKIDAAVFPGGQGGPLMHVIAAKAAALREASQPAFGDYARRVVANARALAAHLAAADLRVVSGGTDTHLLMVSLVGRPLTGAAAQRALERAGISANKNMVPFDPRRPAVTSGLRLGTPAVTARGMGEAEMEQVAALLVRVLQHPEEPEELARVRVEVEALARRFPLYEDRFGVED